MKKNDLLLLTAVALYSYLFYHQTAGINFLLFTIGLILLLLLKNGFYRNLLNIPWWCTVMGSILSAVCILLYGSTLPVIANIISLSMVAAFSVEKNSSFLLAALYSFCSYAASVVFMFTDWVEIQHKKAKEGIKKGFRLFLLIIPIFISLLFFFLYREANPLFKNFTANINFDFITWSWVEFTFLGFVLLYGFFYHRYIPGLVQKDLKASNMLVSGDYTEHNNMFIGFRIDLANELTTGIILFSLLNLLLLFVNVLDFQYVWLNSQLPEGLNYSEAVHQGIGTLITSILLAVLIILIFFRGHLNFTSSGRTIKLLAYLWVLQNAFMVVSTIIRNQLYVQEYSLTYKRIGVYIYLLLCLIGLFTTLIKIAAARSNWYLFRSNSWLFYGVLILCCFFNWDRIITKFNLTHSKTLDREYLINLSSSNTDQLLASSLMSSAQQEVNFNTLNSLHTKMYRFLNYYDRKEWKSWNLEDETIYGNIIAHSDDDNMKDLVLSGGMISALGPLTTFRKTRSMDLSNNPFKTLSELASFPEVEELNLNNNNLDSLHTIPALSKLISLNLGNNSIRDFHGLYKLRALKKLDISYNKNDQLTSLPAFEHLQELNVSGNKLGSLHILKQFKNLQILRMNAVNKTELETLPALSSLRELELRNLNLSGSDEKAICAISELKGLKKLTISSNTMRNLYLIPQELFSVRKSTEGLNAVLTRIPTSIESLDISYNQIATLDGIENLPMLHTLDISSNELSDISVIEKSTLLKSVSLSRNKIIRIDALETLTQLQSLSLDNNMIHDLKPIAGLRELQTLNVSFNRIADLHPLAGMKKLSYLNIANTSVTNLNAIEQLSNLQMLDISNCPITDLSPLYKLKSLKKLYAYGIDQEKLAQLKTKLPLLEITEYTITEAYDYR